MALTPLDIQEKAFSSSLFGYHKGEVDQFLAEVAETLKEVQRENNALKDEVARLQKEVQRYQAEEHTIREAILKAQSLAETLKEEAQKEADLIVSQAKEEAASLVREAEEKRRTVLEEIERLRQERERLFLELRSILNSWQEHLERVLQPK